jgi:hypothetical protein
MARGSTRELIGGPAGLRTYLGSGVVWFPSCLQSKLNIEIRCEFPGPVPGPRTKEGGYYRIHQRTLLISQGKQNAV